MDNAQETDPRPGRGTLRWVVIASLAIIVLWSFPKWWYTRTDAEGAYLWFHERQEVNGATFESQPIEESAERLLVADRTINGTFTLGGDRPIRVFSAKRYEAKEDNIGLFVHTPDRCWTQAGWRIEPVEKDHVELVVDGVPMTLERRIFSHGGRRELVYFGGLVGGQRLPYRLDHNLGVAYRVVPGGGDASGGAERFVDGRFWGRIWDAFESRRPVLGPKQFLRISTPLAGISEAAADAMLQDFLSAWLEPASYEKELAEWRARTS